MDRYPFPHKIIDNALDKELLHDILEVYPKKDSKIWHRKENATSKKCCICHLDKYTERQYELLNWFNSYYYLEKFEEISGIRPIFGDPYLTGGGFHCIERGGFLGIHADFNIHPKLWIYRKLNVLIYLNEDWKDEWGGHLELWDNKTRECVKKISPIMNRMVIFETSKNSLHGHPKPLNCPEYRCRRSIAFYYYIKDIPESDKERHTTIYV